MYVNVKFSLDPVQIYDFSFFEKKGLGCDNLLVIVFDELGMLPFNCTGSFEKVMGIQ